MHAAGEIPWATLVALTGNRMGQLDVPCPLCSHLRKPVNRKKPVLHIWRDERPDFATFCCAHCGAAGYAHSDDPSVRRIDQREVALLMRKADKARHEHVGQRRRTARPVDRVGAAVRQNRCALP